MCSSIAGRATATFVLEDSLRYVPRYRLSATKSEALRNASISRGAAGFARVAGRMPCRAVRQFRPTQ